MDDFEVFRQPDFDVQEWVNQNVQQRNTIIPRLTLRAQDINDQLERSMSSILNSIPRVNAESERLHHESEALLPTLTTLAENVEQINPKPGVLDPLETLGHLNTIKKNIQACCVTLVEAANWQRLVREVEANFAAKNLSVVATRLSDLHTSLKLLQGMPEQERRIDILERFEGRLEAMVIPGLRDSLADEDNLDGVKEYIGVFDKLGRGDSLVSEYAVSRSRLVTDLWKSFASNPASTQFTQWLPRFFDGLRKIVDNEKKRATDLFQERSVSVVADIICQSFVPLNAEFEALVLNGGHLNLETLESVYRSVEKFLGYSLDSWLGPVDVTPPSGPVQRVVGTLMKPMEKAVAKIGELQMKQLTSQLSQGAPAEFGSSSDAKIRASLSRNDVFDIAETSLDLSLSVQSGVHLAALLSSVSMFISQYIKGIAASLSSGQVDQDWAARGPDQHFTDALSMLKSIGQFHHAYLDFLTVVNERTTDKCGDLKQLVNMGNVTDIKAVVAWLALQNTSTKSSVLSLSDRLHRPLLPGADDSFAELVNLGQQKSLGVITEPIVHDLKSLPQSEFAKKSEESVSGPLPFVTGIGGKLTGDEVLSFVSRFEEVASSSSTVSKSALLANSTVLLRPDLEQLEKLLSLNKGYLLASPFLPTSQAEDDLTGSWLSCVVRETSLLYCIELCKVENLYMGGLVQVETDVGYLENVVASLGGGDDCFLQIVKLSAAAVRGQICGLDESLQPRLVQEMKRVVKELKSAATEVQVSQ